MLRHFWLLVDLLFRHLGDLICKFGYHTINFGIIFLLRDSRSYSTVKSSLNRLSSWQMSRLFSFVIRYIVLIELSQRFAHVCWVIAGFCFLWRTMNISRLRSFTLDSGWRLSNTCYLRFGIIHLSLTLGIIWRELTGNENRLGHVFGVVVRSNDCIKVIWV